MKWKGHLDRVYLCADMLSQGWKKGQVKKALREKYNISAHQCDRYVSRARRHLLELSHKDRDEAKGESLEFYRSVLKDPKLQAKTRMEAQTRIDKIYGLEEPTQVNQFVTGKQETKVTIEYSGDEWQQQRFDVALEGAAGEGNADAN